MTHELTMAQLIAAAVDMNLVMGLKPFIGLDDNATAKLMDKFEVEEVKQLDAAGVKKLGKELEKLLKKADADELEEDIILNAEEARASDKFQDTTWALLAELEVLPDGVEVPVAASGEEDADGKEDKEATPAKATKKKATKKPAKPTKKPATKKPEKKKAEKKPAKKAVAKKPEKKADKPTKKKAEKKPAKKKEPKEPQYTRNQAFADAVKGGVKDVAKLIEKADALYVKHGGKSDARASLKTHRRAVGVLVALELAVLKDGKLTMNK